MPHIWPLKHGYTAVQLETLDELYEEGRRLGHFLKAGSRRDDESLADRLFDPQNEHSGLSSFYSIRDAQGHPVASIELGDGDHVEHMEGYKGRSHYAFDQEQVDALTDFLKVKSAGVDFYDHGFIHQDGQYYLVTHLPENFQLHAPSLNGAMALEHIRFGERRLPKGLHAPLLDLAGSDLPELPEALQVQSLLLSDSRIKKLPHDLNVGYLDLTDTGIDIKDIPTDAEIGELVDKTGQSTLPPRKMVSTQHARVYPLLGKDGIEIG